MGLFGKLFDKKECSICGGEIGLLGNRKLENGNLCKECAGKLSPWFDDRRHSTVEQISKQLEYRKANKEKLTSFTVTRTLGENMKVLLDEDAGQFVVTSSRRLDDENPDIIAFSDVTGCALDIEEDREELMRKKPDGEEVSYSPPRYVYEYDFYITIHVRNPYFDDIHFRLNSSTVSIEGRNIRPMPHRYGGGAPMNFGGGFDPVQSPEYRQYKEMGEEIKDILLQVRQQAREEKIASEAPKAAVVCPYCGAHTTPDASGRCEYCGGAVGR